ncbi:hypothetical protein CPB85DRAFT_1359353 [Mucidula mucida]|nr:hypothetical protein CPB85DRAFT_1359353 [Mucidula mucida]
MVAFPNFSSYMGSTARPSRNYMAFMGALALGTTAIYLSRKTREADEIPRKGYTQGNVPNTPVSEHNSHHVTRDSEQAKSFKGAPSPQASKGDGSGLAYTKAPDYVRSYGKDQNQSHRDDPYGVKNQ